MVGIKNEELLPRCPFLADSETAGPATSLIAIAHTLLIICWHLLHDETTFNELRTAYLEGKDQPERRRRLLVGQLEQLGWNVELTPAA